MAKIQLLFKVLQPNNGLMKQNLTHKNTSLSNVAYSNAQLRILYKKAHNYNLYHQLNFEVWTT
jgi:hypothetical protein